MRILIDVSISIISTCTREYEVYAVTVTTVQCTHYLIQQLQQQQVKKISPISRQFEDTLSENNDGSKDTFSSFTFVK